jgi:hypothetical protein
MVKEDYRKGSEAASNTAGWTGKVPSINGLPLTAMLSEELMNWYCSEVSKGNISDPWTFFLMLGKLGIFGKRKNRSDVPFEYDIGSIRKKYKALRAAGVPKETICKEATSNAAHTLHDTILLLFGMVLIGMAGFAILGPIGGGLVMSLSGGSTLSGAPALLAAGSICLPGPIIGALLGHMLVKGSNDTRRRKTCEKIDEIDRTA